MWKLAAKYLCFISVTPLKTANDPDGGLLSLLIDVVLTHY